MGNTKDLGLLIARVLLALMYVVADIGKINSYGGTQGYMQSMGVPGDFLPLVILVEVGGGLVIILGAWTNLVAVLLAGFTLVAALIFHHNFADQNQMIHFMKNISITGGFLALAVAGAGGISVDAWRSKRS